MVKKKWVEIMFCLVPFDYIAEMIVFLLESSTGPFPSMLMDTDEHR